MLYDRANVAQVLLATWLLLFGACMGKASAQDTIHKSTAPDGTVIFSDAPVKNGRVLRIAYKSAVRKPVSANPCYGLTPAQLDTKALSLEPIFSQTADLHRLDVTLLFAVARAESCFNPRAVSHAGATGIMQLMPATAEEMGVRNIFDMSQNLNGGAQYLAAMLSRYRQDLELALAAYNAGPGNVDRYAGVPPFNETRRYIRSVQHFRQHFQTLIGNSS